MTERARVLLRCTITLAAAIGVALFVVVNHSTVATVAGGMSGLHLRPAAGGVFLSLAAIVNRGLLNRAAHEALGMATTPAAMTRTAAVGFTANKVVKSAGVSGLAVLIRSGNRRGFDTPRIVAACAATAVAAFAALGALIGVTILVLRSEGELGGWWLAAAAGYVVYSAVAVCIGLAAWRSRTRARQLAHWVRRTRCALTRRPAPERATDAVDELYDALGAVRHAGGPLRRMFAHALLSKALGVLMLMSAMAAVGTPTDLRTALVVYAASLGASLVAFVPGGIGVVEASASALLVATGAPVAAAVLAVAVFRLLDVWLPVLVGLALGRAELRAAPPSPEPVPAVPATVAVAT